MSDILAHHRVIALDCEGVNGYAARGPICLLQISVFKTNDDDSDEDNYNDGNDYDYSDSDNDSDNDSNSDSDIKIYIFDIQSNRDLLRSTRLRELLESHDIVKVIHDSRNDSAALYYQYGIELSNVFDTQVAHSVLQKQKTRNPSHNTSRINLNFLCHLYDGPKGTPNKDEMKDIYRQNPRFWTQRPMSCQMVDIAAYDVFALISRVYQNMSNSNEHEYWPLFQSFNLEAVLAKINHKLANNNR